VRTIWTHNKHHIAKLLHGNVCRLLQAVEVKAVHLKLVVNELYERKATVRSLEPCEEYWSSELHYGLCAFTIYIVLYKLQTYRYNLRTRRRRKARLRALFKAYLGYKAWVDIKRRLYMPIFYGRGDHKFKIKLRQQRTHVGKFSFLNRTIVDWNNLPAAAFEGR
jgi:hypothetical protein